MSAIVRTAQHALNSGWFFEVANITIETFQNRRSAEAAEIEAIEREKPIYNVRAVTKETSREQLEFEEDIYIKALNFGIMDAFY